MIDEVCRDKFNEIDAQLEAGNKHFSELDKKIVQNTTEIEHLVSSIKFLTGSLWGLILTLLTIALTTHILG